ncbi:MAG TPA: decaprenyl-phosphate phosphoribosyltransferase [Candidatus Melainabacteria bacterium]|nr:decaprenyl-phosphate phosphoribosyltransferase [Candidatus Melainabacteria bacterium]
METESKEEKNKKSLNPLYPLAVLRPRQWTKNFIAFAPLLFSHRFSDMEAFTAVSACTACLCLVSGSVYVANDIKDREADAKHPAKRLRPIASGRVSVGTARMIGITALIIGLVGGFLVRPTVGLTLLLYLLLQVAYNGWLKKQPILDVFSIAAGFVLRAVAGGAAGHVALSAWFLLCTTLGALFLAVEKRRQELKVLGQKAGQHRAVFDKYSFELISRMEAVVVPSLITSYAIYSFNSPSSQWMMITVPFVMYGIFRYQLLSTTRNVTGAPEDVLLKDRPIQISILLWILTSVGVIYGWIPYTVQLIVDQVDSLKLF